MKAGVLGVAAAGLVAATAGSAPAQFVVGGGVYTAPRVSVGVGFTNGGFGVGGFYSTYPAYPVYRPVVVQPAIGWGGYWPGYYRPYYGGYSGWYRPYYGHPHGHHHRW
ncbi:MAG: hypothetical protein U0871_12325 [Gemmataceae bacterium]